MKSFEQIAKAMYEAFRGVMPTDFEWDELDQIERTAFIEAAKAAHKEITEVH